VLPEEPGLRESFDLELIPGGGVYARAFGERTTLLHAAVYFGSEVVARLLLDEGADPEAIDANGTTALQCAAARGLPGVATDRRRLAAVVSLLLARGASVQGVTLPTGNEELDAILRKPV
jgi:ankyrin repeat protein